MQIQKQTYSSYEDITAELAKGIASLDLSNIFLTKEQLINLAEKVDNNAFIGHIVWGALPDNINEIKKQIEDKLVQNNKLYKSHPSDFIHGLLSAHSYRNIDQKYIDAVGKDKVKFVNTDDIGKEHVNAKHNKYLEDWRIEKVFKPKNADDYYSALYINDKTHHAVLAHRGTDILGSVSRLNNNQSLKADIVEILNHNVGAQQAALYASTKESLEIIATNYNNYHFSTTGHSLGAWLAELSLYFCHIDFNYHDVKAVTFDSPGSADQLKVYESNVISSRTKLNTDQLDIVTYLSAPNIVNVCNRHVGEVYTLMPDINCPQALKSEIARSLPEYVRKAVDLLISVNSHILGPILDVFDPETGKPKIDKYKKVLDWPHIKHKTKDNSNNIVEAGIAAIPDKLVLVATKMVTKGQEIAVNVGSVIVPDKLASTAIDKYKKALCERDIEFNSGKKSAILAESAINTVVKLFSVVASFLTNNTQLAQVLEVYKHLDITTSGNSLISRELEVLEQFSLTYKGHYRTQEIEPSRDTLITNNKGSIDWYLSRLNKCKAEVIKKLSEVSSRQLLELKGSCKIGLAYGTNGKNGISSEEGSLSIENIREQLTRLIAVNDEVRDLLENLYRYDVETIIYKTVGVSGKISSNVPERISNFVGREDVFVKMKEILNNSQRVVINAFPGAGKSSVALEYGHRQLGKNIRKSSNESNKQSDIIVRWFNSDSKSKVEGDYRKLAIDLGIDTNHVKSEEVISLVNNAIVKLENPMLLIFDNVENYDDIREYLTNLPRSFVEIIITTRNQDIFDGKWQIMLEPFSETDMEQYIKDSLTDRVNTSQIKDLIKAIGTVPHKVAKAVAYLKAKKTMNINDYIKYINTNPDTEAETGLLIKLVERSPEAWKMLQYAAYLDPDFISLDIFRELLDMDSDDLEQPIEELRSLSLVHLIHLNNQAGLRIHRIVQEVIVQTIAKKPEHALSVQEIQIDLIKGLESLMPGVTNMPDEKWELSKLLYQHIDKVLSASTCIKLIEEGRIYAKIARYHENISCNFNKALENYLASLEIAAELLQNNDPSVVHPVIAGLYENIGIVYNSLGDTSKGLKYFKQALKMNQALYIGDHPCIASSLNSLGIAYNYLGDAVKGLKYLEQALEIRRALYQGNHSDIAKSLTNVGNTYETLGDAFKGLKYKEQALRMYQALYQDNHPDVARSLNSVGNAHETLGDASKGLKYKEQALKMYQALYQGNHPFVATSLNNVGVGYNYLGDASKGLKYFEQALEMRQSLYSGNHPDIAESLNNIGYAYKALGDVAKCLQYEEQALEIMQTLYPGDHPDVAMLLNNIGMSYEALGNADKGLQYEEQALKMRQALYKDNHPSIAETLTNVGLICEEMGDVNKGLSYQEKALEMMQSLYPGNHPSIAMLLNNVGISYVTSNSSIDKGIDKGLLYQERALEMMQALYQGNHPSVATILYGIGDTYKKLKNEVEEILYYERSLSMYQALKLNINTAIILSNMAAAYKGLEDKTKAMELSKQAYLHYIDIQKTDDPNAVALKQRIVKKSPKFFELEEIRERIMTRSAADEKVLHIKQKIQKDILNKIHKQAAIGKWSSGLVTSTSSGPLGDWGVKGYLDEKYVKKILGKKLADHEAIEIAQMLCFEAICLGVMKKAKKDLTCIKEFKKAYPELLAKVITEHSEYMVDGLIVRECVDDHETLVRLLGEEKANFGGQGNAEYVEQNPWMEYTKEGMNEMLKLKLQAIGREEGKIKTIVPNYIWNGSEQATKMLSEQISIDLKDKTLVVLNLFGKHWIGIAIEKTTNSININYMDSEQNPVPILLREQLIKQIAINYPDYNIELIETTLEPQKYNNCGPEVIENIAAYLIGEERTVSQEDAVAIHSLLLEDSLMTEENIL